jgi:phosphomannomutase
VVTQAIADHVTAQGDRDKGLVVGYDSRFMGERFAKEAARVLAGAGVKTFLCKRDTPTPVIAYEVLRRKCAGAINFTASHNPPEYNGMKLFSREGRVIPAAAGQRVLDRYRARAGQPVIRAELLVDELGRIMLPESNFAENDPEEHARLILPLVNVPRIEAREFRVLLDANHGAGGALGRYLLEQLGCVVLILGDKPDGKFEHTPEPTAENLAGVLDQVTWTKANIGFCLDPDADRLAVIDENGRYLGEEYTLAMCVDHVLRNRTQASSLKPQAALSVMAQHLKIRRCYRGYRSDSVHAGRSMNVASPHSCPIILLRRFPE